MVFKIKNIQGSSVLLICIHQLIFVADIISRFKERLEVLSAELKSCAKRPGEALLKAVKIFIDTVERHVEGTIEESMIY